MYLSPEKYLILFTSFAVVFGTSLYVQSRIQVRCGLKNYSESANKPKVRLIDWLILFAITALLAYLVR